MESRPQGRGKNDGDGRKGGVDWRKRKTTTRGLRKRWKKAKIYAAQKRESRKKEWRNKKNENWKSLKPVIPKNAGGGSNHKRKTIRRKEDEKERESLGAHQPTPTFKNRKTLESQSSHSRSEKKRLKRGRLARKPQSQIARGSKKDEKKKKLQA